MNTLSYISVHHYGGRVNDIYAQTGDTPVSHIDQAHKERWPDFCSSLGFWIGYNAIILRDGRVVWTRALGEETAHTKGYNTSSIGICFAGNFTLRNGVPVEQPTQAQTLSFLNLCVQLFRKDYQGIPVVAGTQFNLSVSRIYPHRVLQPNHTECYGSSLDNNWARSFVIDHYNRQLSYLFVLLSDLLMKLKRPLLAGSDRSCPPSF